MRTVRQMEVHRKQIQMHQEQLSLLEQKHAGLITAIASRQAASSPSGSAGARSFMMPDAPEHACDEESGARYLSGLSSDMRAGRLSSRPGSATSARSGASAPLGDRRSHYTSLRHGRETEEDRHLPQSPNSGTFGTARSGYDGAWRSMLGSRGESPSSASESPSSASGLGGNGNTDLEAWRSQRPIPIKEEAELFDNLAATSSTTPVPPQESAIDPKEESNLTSSSPAVSRFENSFGLGGLDGDDLPAAAAAPAASTAGPAAATQAVSQAAAEASPASSSQRAGLYPGATLGYGYPSSLSYPPASSAAGSRMGSAALSSYAPSTSPGQVSMPPSLLGGNNNSNSGSTLLTGGSVVDAVAPMSSSRGWKDLFKSHWDSK